MNRYITIINGASLAGAIAFGLFLTSYHLLSLNPFGAIKFFGLAVPALLMYNAVKKYKEIEGEGFLTYGKGFLTGVIFTFVYASLSAMLVYLYGLIIDGSFVQFFIDDILRSLGEAKEQIISLTGEDSYKERIEEFQNFDLASLALGDFQSKTMGGFIIALIVAAILKQKPPIFESTDE